MVVGPASTLDRWKNEVAKWAPSMDAVIYRAPEEDRVDMLGPFLPLPGQGSTGKILITSYEMFIRDTKYLKRCAWKFVILDEGAPSPRPHAALTLPSPRPYAARCSLPHTMPHPRTASAPNTLDAHPPPPWLAQTIGSRT